MSGTGLEELARARCLELTREPLRFDYGDLPADPCNRVITAAFVIWHGSPSRAIELCDESGIQKP